jgi:hypothetical protein
MVENSVVQSDATTTSPLSEFITTQAASWNPTYDSYSDPKGRLEIGFEESWKLHRSLVIRRLGALAAGMILIFFIGGSLLASSSVPFDNALLLISILWSGSVVLSAYLILTMITWTRVRASPSIYENGVVLLAPDVLELMMSVEYVFYKDLQVRRRTRTGLHVRSLEGRTFFLPERVFGEDWLRNVEERIRHGSPEPEPPRLVLYPKASGRLRPL